MLRNKLFELAATGVAIFVFWSVDAVAGKPAAHTGHFPLSTEHVPANLLAMAMIKAPMQPQAPAQQTARAARKPVAVQKPRPPAPSVFQREQAMGFGQLMKRWEPTIAKAAKKFSVPAAWIREVMRVESGGRTMMSDNVRIISSQGALGLMQIQPGTFAEMSRQYGFGRDPFDPHDNIFAGAAYLRWLRDKYGYPAMFEAYNDGPGNLETRTAKSILLPAETLNYVKAVTVALGDKPPAQSAGAAAGAVVTPAVLTTANNGTPTSSIDTDVLRNVSLGAANTCVFTQPSGWIETIDCSRVTSVREPRWGEFSYDVQAVLMVGTDAKGVRENVDTAKQTVLSHGGKV